MRSPSFFVVVLSLAACLTAGAQSKQPTPSPPAIAEKTEAELAAERLLLERQANAQSLLINLAVDARHFKDDTVRARALARIADMLWENDPERSRSLFRSAWDAAENADAKGRERMLEDLRQKRAANPRGGYSWLDPGNVRREVLDLVSRRDRVLSEEFLEKYRDQKTRETPAEREPRPSPFVGDEATQQRFELANKLLVDGEIERALQFAGPGMGSINMQSIGFLARLRERNAAAADALYASMVVSAPNNPQSEANTVALLATYLFTPHTYVVFRPQGGVTAQNPRTPAPPINAPVSLRTAFFQAATAILLRPVADSSNADSDSQYLALRRMMPLFEQYAPAELNRALRTQLEGLSAAASSQARNRDDQYTRPPTVGNDDRPSNRDDQPARPGPEARNPPDAEQSLLERRERAKTAAERDQINLQLALMMVERDGSRAREHRAREYVEKIDDMELRNDARGYVDASIAWNLISRRSDIEQVLELAQKGQLTPFQKTWLLVGAARFSNNRNREQLLSLVDYATAEARRIETSDPDRPRAFLAIANVVFNFNRAAIWDAMSDAVKAVNSADRFTGEGGAIAFHLKRKGNNSGHQHTFSDFDIAGIFGKLAKEDYEKTVELARAIQNETPRANATIAIATAVLGEKKK